MKHEKEIWDQTKAMFQDFHLSLGKHWSYNFLNDPKRLAFVLSRYKFAAKIACQNINAVLELGCSEGIGATILAEKSKNYFGIDLDEPAIIAAKSNMGSSKFSFEVDDFMGKKYGLFDAVVSLDVVEHIHLEFEDQYFQTVSVNLQDKGVCVIGTPNITSSPFASTASQLGHVNLYSQERLVAAMRKYFHVVFPFGMNDETMHTGFSAMAHYLLCVGCHKK